MVKKINILVILFVFYFIFNVNDSLGYEIIWKDTSALKTAIASNTGHVYNDHIYSIGGSGLFLPNKANVEIATINIDGTLSDWKELNTQITSFLIWHTSHLIGNTIFVIGGAHEDTPGGTTPVNSVLAGNIINNDINSWNLVGSLPITLALHSSVKIMDYIYVIGGVTSSSKVSVSEIYLLKYLSGTLGSPLKIGNLPYKIKEHSSVDSIIENEFFIVGGVITDNGNQEITDKVTKATIDPITGGVVYWNDMPLLPEPLSRPNVIRYKNYIIVAGGYSKTLKRNTSNVYYSRINLDGQIENWHTSPQKLPSELCCSSFTEHNGFLYLIGGYDGLINNYSNRVLYAKVGDVIPELQTETTPTPTPTPTPTIIPTDVITPTPSSTPESRSSIIFLPGMGGSWNYEAIVHQKDEPNDNGWILAPYTDVYDNLLKTFELNGWTKDKDLFVYAYDWRRDLSQTADYLNSFIESKGKKFILVGHSMGGVLARTYAYKYGVEHLEKIITLGSPHHGTAMSYKIWEGGDTAEFLSEQKIAINTLLAINSPSNKNRSETARKMMPSFLNLFPTYNFLIDNNSNKELPLEKMFWRNNLPALTNNLPNFGENLIVSLIGNNHVTLDKYVINSPRQHEGQMDMWIDGKPIKSITTNDGDGTILIKSAKTASFVNENIFSDTDHGEIVNNYNSLNRLLKEAGAIDPIYINSSQYKKFNKSVVVTVSSPVKFSVTENDNEYLPGSENIVVIDDPTFNNLSIKLTAMENNAHYVLFVGITNGNKFGWNIVPGQTGEIGTNQENPIIFDLSRNDLGLNPINNILYIINLMIDETNKGNNPKAINNVLQNDLINIKKSLDKYSRDTGNKYNNFYTVWQRADVFEKKVLELKKWTLLDNRQHLIQYIGYIKFLMETEMINQGYLR